MQIHDLNTGTPASGHYLAMDSGTDTYKATPGNIKPAYTTGDSSTATSWTSVTAVATGLSFSTLINRITTMMKNVRYLYNILGSSTFSTVASTVTGAIGNTALGTTATTLSGAIAEHESDISTLNGNTIVAGRNLKIGVQNYGASLTLDGTDGGNSAGILIVGAGSDASLWAFTYRPANTSISLQKIGGNNSVTITGTVTSTGTITITPSTQTTIMAIYLGA